MLHEKREVNTLIQVDRTNDDGATEVRGRLALIMELRAEGAAYWQSNSNIWFGKINPMKIVTKKRGPPPSLDREAAFLEIINTLMPIKTCNFFSMI